MSYCPRCKKLFQKEDNPQLALNDDLQGHWCEEYYIHADDGSLAGEYYGTDHEEVAIAHARYHNDDDEGFTQVLKVRNESGVVKFVEVIANVRVEYSSKVMGAQ